METDMSTETMSAVAFTPLSNGAASPTDRSESPSPSTSPSLALDAVPMLDRSTSTPTSSIASTLSTNSSTSRRLSDGATVVVRRRGYMRPQGTSFADSARNRDSVMSLGSIAHMQYYFARTGLLDGKGAQLAREKDMKRLIAAKENADHTVFINSDELAMSTLSFYDTPQSCAVSDPSNEQCTAESPIEFSDGVSVWSSTVEPPPMLPPTVSTYKQKPSYTEPLPDMPVLRRELKEALQDACKVLEETQKPENSELSETATDGFFEIQGLHLLDIITLAIRAAKNYYTAHTNPHKLYALKSEKDIRADLYKVLEVLKRMASRNFRGGVRISELTDIILWIESIDKLIKKEEKRELDEAAEREAFAWREGDWTGREREREWLFLKSFDNGPQTLPRWPESATPSAQPTEFLKALQDGQRLISLHNALVAKSKHNFDEIKTWHTDVAKPYRIAENLRFWVKAAELRWELKLTIPISDLANGKANETAWTAFDDAIFEWSASIRHELTEEWKREKNSERRRMPELKVELTADGEATENGIETSSIAPVAEHELSTILEPIAETS